MPRRQPLAPLRQYSALEIETFLERALTTLTGQPVTVKLDGLDFKGKGAELRLTVR